jgi:signal transduction histidine kinase
MGVAPGGVLGAAPDALPPATFGLAHTTTKDEFGQLTNGIRTMLTTLQTQWNMLRRLDHFRREGISNLSHDLRSPLTATTACLETLDTRWAHDAQRTDDRTLVEVALRNTRNAARLVQSLGDLAQLDEPQFQLNTEIMDVSELLDDVALRFAERAASQGVSIQAHSPHLQDTTAHTALEPLAAVDVELLERALANLVDNALKFCSAGAHISLDAARVDGEVRLSVSDTGPGIPAADVPHLFDRFYQSRHSVAPATGEGGKGLGLAIVKRIVELHGGQVQVHSELGLGTQVVLHLPSAV